MIMKWWRRRQRNIDRKMLFPLFDKHSANDSLARQAINKHITIDPAWRYPKEWENEDIRTGKRK